MIEIYNEDVDLLLRGIEIKKINFIDDDKFIIIGVSESTYLEMKAMYSNYELFVRSIDSGLFQKANFFIKISYYNYEYFQTKDININIPLIGSFNIPMNKISKTIIERGMDCIFDIMVI